MNRDSFTAGRTVTGVAQEQSETFIATPEQEAALLDAIAEVERGETVSSDKLIQRLRQIA